MPESPGATPREYIRHPSEIPIDYEVAADHPARGHEALTNVSVGGLCFHTSRAFAPGDRLHVRIPVQQPVFEADGEIIWCRPIGDQYEVGVRFIGTDTAFNLRMVEQVCHIEQYRQRCAEEENRLLSSEEAAMEWIERHAANFPPDSPS